MYNVHAKKLVHREVKDYIKEWIRKSASPYSSPMVCVRKKDMTLRRCIDYKSLSNKTVQSQRPIPRKQDSLNSLRGNSWFTTLGPVKHIINGLWSQRVYHKGKDRYVFVIQTPSDVFRPTCFRESLSDRSCRDTSCTCIKWYTSLKCRRTTETFRVKGILQKMYLRLQPESAILIPKKYVKVRELQNIAILYQTQETGQLSVIAYGSRTLSLAEQMYHFHSGKLEFLVLKWAMTEISRLLILCTTLRCLFR